MVTPANRPHGGRPERHNRPWTSRPLRITTGRSRSTRDGWTPQRSMPRPPRCASRSSGSGGSSSSTSTTSSRAIPGSRHFTFLVSLHFILPGIVSLASLLATGPLWRVAFGLAGLTGMLAVIVGMRDIEALPGPVRGLGRAAWLGVPLYGIADARRDLPGPRAQRSSRWSHSRSRASSCWSSCCSASSSPGSCSPARSPTRRKRRRAWLIVNSQISHYRRRPRRTMLWALGSGAAKGLRGLTPRLGCRVPCRAASQWPLAACGRAGDAGDGEG